MISEVKLTDIKRYNELGQELNPDFTHLFALQEALLKPYNKIYGYYLNSQLMGFIHLQISFNEADIVNIVVDKDYRKQHIAIKLINYAAKINNLDTLNIEVRENNPAVKFYEHIGFKLIRKISKYYDNADAYFMKRVIK
jgi:ribosomal protein S18 acetylase RimI-like enzyme